MSLPLLVIADDSSGSLVIMTKLLMDVGFSQLHCVASRHALGAIYQHRPALLLLDIHPTNACAAWNMLHRIWFNPASQHIPALVCTSEPRLVRQKATALRAHGCTLLEKPFEQDMLVDMVYPLLGTPIRRIHDVFKEDWLGETQLIPVGSLFLITHHSRIMG